MTESYKVDPRPSIPNDPPAAGPADKPIVGDTPKTTAVRMLAAGLWPIPIYEMGETIPRRGTAEGKEPIGKAWGAKRNTIETLNAAYKNHPHRGVGLGLGPGRGPNDSWPIDVEGDGPEAEESRVKLYGGEDVVTLGWGSARGGHQLLLADLDRMATLLCGITGLEVKGGPSPGVYHLPEFPGLEIRIGGFKPDGSAKQIQSVFPPTVGTDGKPRQWNGVSTIAAAPESLYAALERAGKKPAPEPIASAPREPTPATAAASTRNGTVDHPDDLTPWDDYIARTTWPQLLPGWEWVGEDAEYYYLRRPFKDSNHSATISKTTDKLKIFTSSTPPFEAGKVYNRFEAYCQLEHGGTSKEHIRKGAKELRRLGYGSKTSRSKPSPSANGDALTPPSAEGSVGFSSQVCPKFEGSPRPLTTDLLPVPILPAAMIPAPLRGWLTDIARRGCFPLEYPVASALVGISSLIGRNLTIKPKRCDSWTVVPNLWGGAVGPPGVQKSPSVQETMAPLRRLVVAAIEAAKVAEQRALEDAAIAEARSHAAKKKLADGAKKNLPDSVLRELAAEANQAQQIIAPTTKRYIVNDATIEKFGELLRDHPRGLFQFRDELTGFFRSLEQKGHEQDKGFYLQSSNGDTGYTFDRIGRGTIHIPAACISLFGTVQPGPLARYIKRAASADDADGFMPRFQILVYPDIITNFVNVDEWPDTQAKNTAYEVYRWIDAMDPLALAVESDPDTGLAFLRFDDAAQALFDEWREELENRLRSGTESSLLTCHLAKYRSLMPSLALLFHVVASVGTPRFELVSRDAAELAIAWCALLEAHARRIYQAAADGDPEAAEQLAGRLKKSLPNPFTYRQVVQKGWTGLDDVDAVRKAVGILEDRNWTQVVTKPPGPTGGRPSEEVWINPRIHGEG